MNLSVSLGTSTREKMNSVPSSPVPPSPRKSRTRSSPSKLRRNRARAQDYFERKKLEKVPSLSKTDPDNCLFISEDFISEEIVTTGVSDIKSASDKVSDKNVLCDEVVVTSAQLGPLCIVIILMKVQVMRELSCLMRWLEVEVVPRRIWLISSCVKTS